MAWTYRQSLPLFAAQISTLMSVEIITLLSLYAVAVAPALPPLTSGAQPCRRHSSTRPACAKFLSIHSFLLEFSFTTCRGSRSPIDDPFPRQPGLTPALNPHFRSNRVSRADSAIKAIIGPRDPSGHFQGHFGAGNSTARRRSSLPAWFMEIHSVRHCLSRRMPSFFPSVRIKRHGVGLSCVLT